MLSKEEVQLAIIARFPRICSTHCWPLYMFVLESTQVSFSIFAKSTYPSYSIFLPNNFINSLSSMNLSGRLQKNKQTQLWSAARILEHWQVCQRWWRRTGLKTTLLPQSSIAGAQCWNSWMLPGASSSRLLGGSLYQKLLLNRSCQHCNPHYKTFGRQFINTLKTDWTVWVLVSERKINFRKTYLRDIWW